MSQNQQFQAIKPYILQNFQQYRILQPDVVFVHGLSQRYARIEVLGQQFCQYGKISNISIQFISKNFYSAFVYFQDAISAALTVSTLNNLVLQNRILRVSYASTKFCPSFLKNQMCTMQTCNYAHYYYPELAHLKDFAKQISHDLIAQNKILENYETSLFLVYHSQSQKGCFPSGQSKLRQIFYRKNSALIQESLTIQKRILQILIKSGNYEHNQHICIKHKSGNDWQCIDEEITEFVQEQQEIKQIQKVQKVLKVQKMPKSNRSKVQQFLEQAEQTLMNLIFKSSQCVY